MSTEKHQHVNPYVADLCEPLRQKGRGDTMNEKLMPFYWSSDLVLVKADAYQGRRKMKDWGEEEPYKVECRIA